MPPAVEVPALNRYQMWPIIFSLMEQTTGPVLHAWVIVRGMTRVREMMLAYPNSGLTKIRPSVGYQSKAAFSASFERVKDAIHTLRLWESLR